MQLFAQGGGVGVASCNLYQPDYVKTPEASKLITHVTYPVNYSTGAVDISIPLFTVECGSLKLPISLSYNTTGLKVDEPSGWVGEGWTLHAEPAIVRNVKAKVDDHFKFKLDKDLINSSFYNGYDYVSGAMDYTNPYCNDTQPDQYYYTLADTKGMFLYAQKPDSSYDYISYPFNDVKVRVDNNVNDGGSHLVLTDNKGTTYYFDGSRDLNGTIEVGWKASKMVSADGLDCISFDYLKSPSNYNVPLNISYINVLDNFSLDIGPSDSIDCSYVHAATRSENNEYGIGAPYGFSYHPEEYLKRPVIVFHENDKVIYGRLEGANQKLILDDNVNSEDPKELYYYSHCSPCTNRLSSINFKGNTIKFISNHNEKKYDRLEKIIISNSLGETVKEIHLHYLKLNKWDESENQFLSSVSFVTGKDSVSYQFSYYKPTLFPWPGDPAKDFWGYHNNGYNTDSYVSNGQIRPMVPQMKMNVYCNNYDSITIGSKDMFNRAADEEFMKRGSLSSIDYPTGVRDSFIFEANQVYLDPPGSRCYDEDFHLSDHLHQVKGKKNIYYAGGLRVKQIFSFTRDGKENVRTFKYNEDGSGISPINNDFNYFSLNRLKWYENSETENFMTRYRIDMARCRTFSSSPIIPIEYNNGANVLYQKVTEYQGTEKDNNGYTVYEYDMPDYIQGNSARSAQEFSAWYNGDSGGDYNMDENVYTPKGYGNLIRKTIHQKNGIISEQDIYHYSNDGQGSNKIGSFEFAQFYLKNIPLFDINKPDINMSGSLLYITPGEIFYQGNHTTKITTVNIPKHYMTGMTQTLYYNGKPGVTTEMTNICGHLLSMLPTKNVISRKTEDPESTDEEYAVTTYKYPMDYNCEPYTSMTKKNILSPVVKTTSHTKNTTSGENVNSVENTYSNIGTSAAGLPIYRLTKAIYTYDDSQPLNSIDYKYDVKTGKLIQASKDGGSQIATYLYGYNAQYPIAAIYNASYDEVCDALSMTDNKVRTLFTYSQPEAYWYNLYKLGNSLPHAIVHLYKYKPLIGVSQQVNEDGSVVNYSYDGFGRLSGTSYQSSNKATPEPKMSIGYHYQNNE